MEYIMGSAGLGVLCVAIFAIVLCFIVILMIKAIIDAKKEKEYRGLENEVLEQLEFPGWDIIDRFDEVVNVKSRQTLEKYDSIRFFREHPDKLPSAQKALKQKGEVAKKLREFLKNNEYKERSQYNRLEKQINAIIEDSSA